jgi:hypothetical protein
MVSSAGVLENLDRFVSLTPLGAAAETARRMAFPLTLMILVFVFLIAQNAFDKRDPKLAMAASSQKETMLTFS